MALAGFVHLVLRDAELVQQDFENLVVGVHDAGGADSIAYGRWEGVSRNARRALRCHFARPA
jgi:hypothetical protein